MNQDKEVHLETKIMKKIKDEKINFRSKYIFLAQKLGLGGGLALSLLLAILFLNLAFFTMRVSGSLEFLSFGRIGILAFLESFPYHWILMGLIFFVIASTILSRYDISYKKPFKKILTVLLVLIFVASTALAISGINEVIEEKVAQDKIPFLRSFYGRERGIWKNGLVGEVIEIRIRGLVVETRHKQQVFIELTKNTFFPGESDFKVGDHIRAVGEWDGENFRASALRLTHKWRRSTSPLRTLP
jgi:hypothetical protein